MRLKALLLTCALLALPAIAWGQPTKMWKKMTVTFDQPVKVSEQLMLQPGEYTFRQIREKTEPTQFEVMNSSGKTLGVTSVAAEMVYKTSDPGILPKANQVILKQVGNNWYLEKMWFAGQNFGFRFSTPKGNGTETANANNGERVIRGRAEPDNGPTTVSQHASARDNSSQ